MSWNNGYESYKFKKNAEKTKKYLSENGMNNEQIEAMIAYDKRNHLNERNQSIKKKTYELSRKSFWCLFTESNHGHRDFQSLALPTELNRHIKF